MTTPQAAAHRFLAALALGCILGLVYGFLRPLRPRRTTLADGIFLLAALWAWLVLNFEICRGDIRLGYCAGLAAGAFFWEWTAGKLLRPLFGGFGGLFPGFTGCSPIHL